MRYSVRLEFTVSSSDMADLTVEANSPEEAKQLAIKAYHNGAELDYYASDYHESSLDTQFIDDWEVEPLT